MKEKQGSAVSTPKIVVSSNVNFNIQNSVENDEYQLIFEDIDTNKTFYQKGNFYYVIKDYKRREPIYEEVGPAVQLLAMLEDPETRQVSYLCRYKQKQFQIDSILDMETIQKVTGKTITKPKDFAYLLNHLSEQCEMRLLFNRTGWYQGQYFTPIIAQDGVEWKKDTYYLDFQRKEPQKQIKFIQDALAEGRLLGILYTISLISMFPDSAPFVTYIAGQRGVGKTTACLLATNIYGAPKQTHGASQLFATSTGLELTLSQCKDTSILFDEALVNTDDHKLEAIIFQIAGGRSKTRGRKDLTVEKGMQLKVGMFTTSERLLELTRGGTMRRLFMFEVGEQKEITELFTKQYNLKEVLTYGGCIKEFVEFYMRNPEKYSAQEGEKLATKLNAPSSFIPAVDLARALLLLEGFYKTKFDTLRNNIRDWFLQMNAELNKDLLSYFLEAFPEWVLSNIRAFRVEDSVQMPSGESYGILKKIGDNQYYAIVFASAFSKFCKENPSQVEMPRNILLKQLKDKKLLYANEGDYYRRREDTARYFYILVPISLRMPEAPSIIEQKVAEAYLSGNPEEEPGFDDFDDEEELSEADILPF